MKSRRYGKVQVSQVFLRDAKKNLLNEIYRDARIFRAESLYYNDTIEYSMEHPNFDEIREGEVIPSYDLILEKRERQTTKTFTDDACFVTVFKGFRRISP